MRLQREIEFKGLTIQFRFFVPMKDLSLCEEFVDLLEETKPLYNAIENLGLPKVLKVILAEKVFSENERVAGEHLSGWVQEMVNIIISTKKLREMKRAEWLWMFLHEIAHEKEETEEGAEKFVKQILKDSER
jgi:hypothetical protein